MATKPAILRQRVQTVFDISGSTVLTATELDQFIGDGYRALWNEVLSVNRDFRVNTLKFTLTGGVNSRSVSLPPDFMQERSVRLDPDSDTQRYLVRFGPRSGSQMFDRSYRMNGQVLAIEPLQRAAGNYALDYNPQPPFWAPAAFTVRLTNAFVGNLPAYTVSGGPGPGRTLTANVNGALQIDSVSVAVSDRVLIAANSGAAGSVDNGIYVVSATGSGIAKWVLIRATDYDQNSEVDYGDIIAVTEGVEWGPSSLMANVTPSSLIGIDGLPLIFTFVPFEIDPELDQFSDYIVYHAAIAALGREESPSDEQRIVLYGSPDGTQEGIRQRVKKWAASQRSADPDQIEDVRTSTTWMWAPP